MVLGSRDQPARRGRIRVIGNHPRHRVGPRCCRGEAARGRSGRRLVGGAEHNAGSVTDECPGRGEPEAAAAAGDDEDPVT